jgi:hypothetical protein
LPERLSLLLPVWAGDRPDFLIDAFRSSVDAQTRRPDQVVIVRDGPVPEPLAETVTDLAKDSPVPVDVVELERNVGLGPALDAGLAACTHDVVARMDADDISMPHRFAVQLPIIESGIDIVGSGLVEFADDPEEIVATRAVPTEPAEIRRRARFATPFNHPTVVYRRPLVTGVGGYTDFAKMEDYLLWAKLILADARVAAGVGSTCSARRSLSSAGSASSGSPRLASSRAISSYGVATDWSLRNCAVRRTGES